MGAAVKLGPLEERDFPLLWLGQATSAFGSALVAGARGRPRRTHPAPPPGGGVARAPATCATTLPPAVWMLSTSIS